MGADRISPLLLDLLIEALGQSIRQNGVEHKVAVFADDVLVCLGEQEGSFNELMSTLIDFGYLSGYKVNISKTKVMTLNFTVPSSLLKKI